MVAALVSSTARAGDSLWSVLVNSHQQAITLSYEGTLTTRVGDTSQSSRLKHYSTSEGEFEFLERLDGQPSQWIRHDSEIQCVLPERKLILSEKRRTTLAFPRMMGNGETLSNLKKYYQIQELPLERVAGRPSRVLELIPRDGLRYAYRLNVDKENQLLLKTESYSAEGMMLEKVGFSEINFAVDVKKHPQLMEAGPGWREATSKVENVEESHLPYSLPADYQGFVKMQTLCRTREGSGGNLEVHQTVFSDGLSSVSVFVQKTEQGTHLPGVAMSHGAVTSLSQIHGNYLVTALGEVPESTLKEFLALINWKHQQEGNPQ